MHSSTLVLRIKWNSIFKVYFVPTQLFCKSGNKKKLFQNFAVIAENPGYEGVSTPLVIMRRQIHCFDEDLWPTSHVYPKCPSPLIAGLPPWATSYLCWCCCRRPGTGWWSTRSPRTPSGATLTSWRGPSTSQAWPTQENRDLFDKWGHTNNWLKLKKDIKAATSAWRIVWSNRENVVLQ